MSRSQVTHLPASVPGQEGLAIGQRETGRACQRWPYRRRDSPEGRRQGPSGATEGETPASRETPPLSHGTSSPPAGGGGQRRPPPFPAANPPRGGRHPRRARPDPSVRRDHPLVGWHLHRPAGDSRSSTARVAGSGWAPRSCGPKSPPGGTRAEAGAAGQLSCQPSRNSLALPSRNSLVRREECLLDRVSFLSGAGVQHRT
jgi:hypothetical protein